MPNQTRTARWRWTVEADSRKKLDQQRKEIAKQVRKIQESTDLDHDFVEGQKEKWRQELLQIEQRGMISCQNMRRCRRCHRSYRACKMRNCSVRRMQSNSVK